MTRVSVYDDPTQPFGTLLRLRREEAGLTQRDLARSAGISLAAVRDLEQHRSRRPRASTVQALAVALGLTRDGADQLIATARGLDAYSAASAAPVVGPVLSVLGPLTLHVDGKPATLGSQGQRTLLGLLALFPNAVVPRAQIVDTLWPNQPPDRAVNVIQTHAARLRRLLAPVSAEGLLAIRSVTGGYRLDADAAGLDLVAFEELLDAGRHVERADPEQCLKLLGQALDLWSGDPLSDVEAMAGHPAALGLQERHVAAVHDFADVADRLGRNDLALPRLRGCARRHPLHEPLHTRLITALAKFGDQAGALETYEQIRTALAEELGIDPGDELRQVHRQVLRQELRPAPTSPLVPADHASADQPAADAVPAGATEQMRPAARRRRLRWVLPLVGVLVVLGSIGAVSILAGDRRGPAPSTTTAPAAAAPGSCIKRSVPHRDGHKPSRIWLADFECHNDAGALLYAAPDGKRKIATMVTVRSWFLCWTSGAAQPGGGRIWYYTQGDVSEPGTERLAAWGFMPASSVKIAAHPWTGMPAC
jgi:DNA-binding SARP family transcriptional activator/DNA-binding XRE family transcriptional regulator